ncbi:hypothetical protein JTB14_025179 [Gonioctena quinquepunctata]|nr:hypothetical protein JTB14_025179 [Gonioctena quinquepunctata]
MSEAVFMVLDEHPLREVGNMKSIPYQTLYRCVPNHKLSQEPISMVPRYGVQRIFTREQEDLLANYIIVFGKKFYGLPLIECRQLAYEMTKSNNVEMPDRKGWMRGFRERNHRLSLRTPEGCSLARANAFNEYNVKTFFDELHDCY